MKELNGKTTLAIFFISAFILLQACSSSALQEGTVIKKWYEPATTYLIMIPTTVMIGKSTTIVMVPYTIIDGEDYCVKIQGVDEKSDTTTRTLYVPLSMYDTLNVGQYICVDKNCGDEDLTYKKVRN